MGVYIKDMEMPKSCRECRFCNGQANTDYGVCAWCNVDGKARDAYTMQDCPLIPVPPHGDLIDRKALLADTTDMLHSMMVFGGARVYTSDAIKNAPTIIPASEEGET